MALNMHFIDLSHEIHDGMQTYPGLPVPVVRDHLSREAAEAIYGPGITFQIGVVELCTNTGTYLDVPFHRYPDGHDLTGLSLERVADVPARCIDASPAQRDGLAIDLAPELLDGTAGHAVLVRTDHARHWGTDDYFGPHPHLTAAAAEALVAADVACVGIDSLNIDATEGGERPVHSILLGANVPIIEHLRGLDQLPSSGFRFTAVPPKIAGAGTFTVRAYAAVPDGH